MQIKALLLSFVFYSALVYVLVVLISFLWNLIFYGRQAVAWNKAFALALILGISLAMIKQLKK